MVDKEFLNRILIKFDDLLKEGDIKRIYNLLSWESYDIRSFTSILLEVGYTPEQIIEKCNNELYFRMFNNFDTITEVEIPEGVKDICNYAFAGCKNLKTVYIPNSATRIDFAAFADCKNLKTIDIPEGITLIGDSAFSKCVSLKKIVIPNSVTEIRASAFENCQNLTSISIPSSVTSIGRYAFDKCPNLVITYAGTESEFDKILESSYSVKILIKDIKDIKFLR